MENSTEYEDINIGHVIHYSFYSLVILTTSSYVGYSIGVGIAEYSKIPFSEPIIGLVIATLFAVSTLPAIILKMIWRANVSENC